VARIVTDRGLAVRVLGRAVGPHGSTPAIGAS
jgi:hypothetical protein